MKRLEKTLLKPMDNFLKKVIQYMRNSDSNSTSQMDVSLKPMGPSSYLKMVWGQQAVLELSIRREIRYLSIKGELHLEPIMYNLINNNNKICSYRYSQVHLEFKNGKNKWLYGANKQPFLLSKVPNQLDLRFCKMCPMLF